jgi:hypothetical protein
VEGVRTWEMELFVLLKILKISNLFAWLPNNAVGPKSPKFRRWGIHALDPHPPCNSVPGTTTPLHAAILGPRALASQRLCPTLSSSSSMLILPLLLCCVAHEGLAPQRRTARQPRLLCATLLGTCYAAEKRVSIVEI